MPLITTDAPANANEYIEQAARTVGTGQMRQKVFTEIYKGKKQVKTVSELIKSTGMPRVRVLQEAGRLAAHGVVDKEKVGSETAYRKRDFIQHNKKTILKLANNPNQLQEFPTKWTKSSSARSQTVTIRINRQRAIIRLITVDDIDSFSKVKLQPASGNITSSVSENQFKQGVQKIVGQSGAFTDWGGEINDLFTTRIRIDGKRRATAFGFKGPGTSGKLTPKKMGKNGDQIQRLFESPGDVFLVQYWREIEQSVLRQMEQLAIAKSVLVGGEILYGIIDGEDSNRIYLAYQSKF